MAKAKSRTMAQMKREFSKTGEGFGRLSPRDITKKFKEQKKKNKEKQQTLRG